MQTSAVLVVLLAVASHTVASKYRKKTHFELNFAFHNKEKMCLK